MVDPFTYALREQILPIISNRLQGLLHAFSKQETNYMCENAQHWSQAHYWKREKVSHKNRTERERRRTVAYKQKQWFTSNVVYQIQQQKISNTQFVWSGQLSPILLSHFVNPWRASPRETTLSQNTIHISFFIWHTVLFVSCLLTFNINRKLSKKLI